MAVYPSAQESEWLARKLQTYPELVQPDVIATLTDTVAKGTSPIGVHAFVNPFHIEDLLIFDLPTLHDLFGRNVLGLTIEEVSMSLGDAPAIIVKRIHRSLPFWQRQRFQAALSRNIDEEKREQLQATLLDHLFWELTYWKTPELYEELTAGERLHPGIFRQLRPQLFNKDVLDIGAGTGRATFACLRQGVRTIFAVEPSPGLRNIFAQKIHGQSESRQIRLIDGTFANIPLADNSVDVSLSCSAFTSHDSQGGEIGLVELRRVTRPGGKIIIVWPSVEDYPWLAQHGFSYVAMPMTREMKVHFPSPQSASRMVQRFYGHNNDAQKYVQHHQAADVPFSVLHMNPPHDFCWLTV